MSRRSEFRKKRAIFMRQFVKTITPKELPTGVSKEEFAEKFNELQDKLGCGLKRFKESLNVEWNKHKDK